MAEYPDLSIKGLTLARAQSKDIPAIKAMVEAAYTKYIERIGKPPAPMTADYEDLIANHDVFTLQTADSNVIVGSIVLSSDDVANVIKINNVVVDPAAQGSGYGRVLLDYAESAARTQGRQALVLFTNLKMHENLGFYGKFGFQETERKTEDGYERVYFRKNLG